MRKIFSLVCSLLAIVTLSIGLFGCKDDEPYVKPNLSVSTESLTVSEDAGIIGVEFVLDKAASADITLTYSLGGTAVSPDDYGIVGKDGEVKILKGNSNGVIKIEIADDATTEYTETIEIAFNSDNNEVTFVGNLSVSISISDDEPSTTIAFAESTMAVKESDLSVEVKVYLSHPAKGNVSVSYNLTGTAKDSVSAIREEIRYDYAIRGTTIPGELKIAGGQTEGVIKLSLNSDLFLEDGDPTTVELDPETIVISLTSVSDGIQILPSSSSILINVHQEDGKIIGLFWDENASVDMDLVLWYGNLGTNISSLQPFGGSFVSGTGGQEIVIIPNTLTDYAFGASYVYYSGNVTPLNFEVHFLDLIDGQMGIPDVYVGTYTLANIYVWETITDLQDIEQTFQSAAGVIMDISPISIPLEGSRKSTHPKTIKNKKNIHYYLQYSTVKLQ